MVNAARREKPGFPRMAVIATAVVTANGLVPAAVMAQSQAQSQSISRPVVQPLPDRRGVDLNAALARLGRNPRDVQALIDAGNAALAMGDVDAATGFFRRAEQIQPDNARAKAGLAGAYVRSGNPIEAIPLFDAAEKAGAVDNALAADRGLAYDLVGDSQSAQRFYRLALANGQDEEVVRRLALSQAIAGDKNASEATLLPLLRLQDKAAWRTRAFALAILGDPEEAVRISKTILPADLAAGIAPYLRYMPKLTPAQQASAANFGTFPRASEIGRDDPRIAQYAPAGGRRTQVASADSGLIPQGQPLGRTSKAKSERQLRQERQAAERRAAAARQSQQQAARVAPPEVRPAIVANDASAAKAAPAPSPGTARAAQAAPPAAASTASATTAPKVTARTDPPASARPAQPAVAAVPVPAATAAPGSASASTAGSSTAGTVETARPAASVASSAAPSMSGPVAPSAAPLPGFDLASIAAKQESGTPTPAVTESPSSPPSPPQPRRQSLADAFSDFTRPAMDATPAAGAVDIRSITPARRRVAEPAKAAAPAKPPPPTHPSRIWVQVATGRDKSALAFDWRRIARQAGDAAKARNSFISAWGQTNRLLTGPFESERAANAFIAQLRRAGVDGPFVWTSPAGQVVDQLDAK